VENQLKCWSVCLECKGRGKKSKKSRKKKHVFRQITSGQLDDGKNLVRPKGNLYPCDNCYGIGIIPSDNYPLADKENSPHVAIVGGGIGGVALAVACLHRGISFTLYERDKSFDARSQGYGLTLQQASKAIKALGISSLKEGVNSTCHTVHTTDGNVIVEWGMRKSGRVDIKTPPKRTNIHITRQLLRLALLEQLGSNDVVKWGHQLIDFKQIEGGGVELNFQVGGEKKIAKADILVGADGLRSLVRKALIGEEITPLRYLGCMVILGICPLDNLKGIESPLLDSATVFQTVNGNERIYVMPYTLNSVMWQLSFPISEKEAKALSAKGAHALKEEACRRTHWHIPIPQMVAGTQEALITGYPAYDRELLMPELLEHAGSVTLIGDAAHPMSPFKGQGANQALLDALALARGILAGCRPSSHWRTVGIRKCVLAEFEKEMLERSATKVKDSAEAVQLLHSEIVLRKGDAPKTRGLKAKNT
jgi:salicylate hydroxylase